MEKRIILSQTCSHCYKLLEEIHREGLMNRLAALNIKIDMINKENEYALDRMREALDWLSEHVDSMYGDQESVTPLLIIKSVDGIEEVITGDDEILGHLLRL